MKLRYMPAVLVLFVVLIGGGYYAYREITWLLRPVPHPCYVEPGSIAAPAANPIPDDAPYLGSAPITRDNSANLVLLHRTELFRRSMPSQLIYPAIFSSNGDLVGLFDPRENFIGLFNATTGDVIRTSNLEQPVWWIAFTPEDILIGNASVDRIINVADGTELADFSQRSQRVLSSLTANKNCIAVGTTDNKVLFVTREATDRWRGSLDGPYDIGSVAFSPDGMWLSYTTSGDNDSLGPAILSLWNLEQNDEALNLHLRGGGAPRTDLIFSGDSRLIAAAYFNRIDIFDTVTATRRFTLIDEGPSGNISELAFSTDGSILASGSDGGLIKLWDTETGTIIATYQLDIAIHGLAFNQDSRNLLVVDKFGRLWYWGIE